MTKTRWVIAAAAALALGVLTLPRFMTGGDSSQTAAATTAASCQAEGPANLNLTVKDMHDAEFKLASLKESEDLLAVAREMREHGRGAIWVASDLLRSEKS